MNTASNRVISVHRPHSLSAWVWLTVLLSSPTVSAAEAVLSPDRGVLRPLSAIMIDPGGVLEIEDVVREEKGFRPLATDQPNLGFIDDVVWLRVTVRNPSAEPARRLLVMDYPLLDEVRLYRAEGAGWRVRAAGDTLPFSRREAAYRKIVFTLDLAGNASETLYLRVDTESSAQLGFGLMTPTSLASHVARESAALGAYYGIMLVMFLYNLFLACTLRDRTYGLYCLYLIVYATTQASLNGLAAQLLWPEWVWWGNRASPFLIGASILTILVFSVGFLRVAQTAPRMHRFLTRGLIWAPIALMLLSLTASYHIAVVCAVALMLVLCPFALGWGIWTWWRGYRPGRYYVWAWTAFLAGIAVVSLKNAGVLPTHFLTTYAAQIGSALEVVLLALGLAARIDLLNEEKRAFALEVAETNARLGREIETRRKTENQLEQARSRLEDQVESRTRELVESILELENEVDDHKMTAARLRVAKWEAEAANRSKTQFLANMSHEIRTPLNAIMGFTQLLLRGADFDEMTVIRERYLRNIRESSEHLAAILDQVLDLSSIERGEVVLVPEPVDLPVLLGEVIEAFRGTASEKGLSLDLEMSETLPRWIRIDPGRLKQVLGCLMSNALAFTPEGRAIAITAGLVGNHLHIRVRDQGVGIAPEERARIFEPFEQEDGSFTRRHGGAGLGLALSRRIARLSGGDLILEESSPKGSIFLLELAYEAAAPEDAHASDEVRPARFEPEQTVLVVEDNNLNAEVICAMLRTVGLLSLRARNGDEAVRLFHEQAPDLILMDLHMPLMDGLEATRAIRAEDDRTPIVMVSADAGEDRREAAREAGADDYLSKPVAFVLLMRVLEGYLRSDAPKQGVSADNGHEPSRSRPRHQSGRPADTEPRV